MPFYTFETQDADVDKKEFLVKLSFVEYDAVMAAGEELPAPDVSDDTKGAMGWRTGEGGPVHPDTELPVKTWRRLLDEVNWNSTTPWETSRWDNFEYRAGYNMVKAQQHRREAEIRSHMGTNPLQEQERQIMGDKGFDLGANDMANHEGKIT